MNRHQADCVDRVDRGIRFVADRELFEMFGDPRQRRIAAVLGAPDHRAQLLQVLARLTCSWAVHFDPVGSLVENGVEQV